MRTIWQHFLIASAVAAVPLMMASRSHAQSDSQPRAEAPANAKPATEVPVKQVVLFSSGVGYFEHFGSIQGDGSTELRFKTNQINDILKSLILQDLDGGRVTTITYPSQDPIAKTLRSFQIDITANPPLADLLNQLRGAKVTLKLADATITGTILGVEKKQKPVNDNKAVIERPALNLLVGSSIKSIYIEDVNEIILDDPQLQEELTKALSALSAARDQDKKPVQINFSGNGERRVRLGYVVETPVWKTSYRLILPDDPKEKAAIQGWAIVENQTDNDWKDVQLSLVSGRPISFIQDLYQPLYIPRPVVVPELFASLMPQEYDAGMADRAGAERMKMGRAEGKARRGPSEAPAAAAAPSLEQQGQSYNDYGGALARPIDPIASVASVASAAKVGELFQYTVGNVSLPRQKSAMLPIITDPIEVEKLSIYNANVLAKNPLNGARVKNTTDKHLLAGPITVLESGTYAGDARIDNVPPGQERLLSYGIDLQMLVDATKNKNESALQTGKVVKGVLVITRKNLASQDYVAENKSDKAKALIIEHPLRQGWKLVDTEKPIETTQTLYRFKGSVDAKKSAIFTVKQEIVQSEEIAILPTNVTALDFYSRAGEIPQPVRDALIKAMQLKQALADTERRIAETEQQVQTITQEQNRIRENMRTVNQQSEYSQRLLKKLNDQESQIEKLQTQQEESRKQLEQQRRDLENYLSNLTVG
ncbi:MAG: hypothetical protein H7Z14_13420 [Anaerolineae bacterium]|nr:hypothetical protein [Phycisphaerae bacterium]